MIKLLTIQPEADLAEAVADLFNAVTIAFAAAIGLLTVVATF
jgi:hypothetical protein